jgi:hypothetical protein
MDMREPFRAPPFFSSGFPKAGARQAYFPHGLDHVVCAKSVHHAIQDQQFSGITLTLPFRKKLLPFSAVESLAVALHPL